MPRECWYIDSLDARGGLAFATLRESDLPLTDAGLKSGITAYISPPSFQPEFLESRAPGLALGRAHGQIGIFLNDQELEFESVEAVSEFVRRAYIRGSSSDGPGQGGAEGIVPPPTDQGPFPGNPDLLGSFPNDEADPVRAIVAFADEMGETASRLDLGKSKLVPALIKRPGNLAGDAGAEHLLSAAMHLIHEFHRFVGADSGQPSLKSELFSESLSRVFTKFGLWRLLLHPATTSRPMTPWLTNPSVVGWVHDQVLVLRLRPRFVGNGHTDPFDDLSRILIPMVNSRTGERFDTLQGLLSLLASTPQDALGADSRTKIVRAELGLFAATYLTLGQDCAPQSFDVRSTDLALEYLKNQVKKGFVWLSANFPKIVYAKHVEDLIGHSSSIDRQTPGHPNPSPRRRTSVQRHQSGGSEEFLAGA